MADSDDDIPVLDIEEDDVEERKVPEKEKTTEIPNFRGKVPEDSEKDDSKGSLQFNWDADQAQKSEPSSEDSEDEEDEEDVPEGEVGEEFAKARREALRERREKRLAEEEASDEEEVLEEEELWNFPPDRYNWEEQDLGEEWADAWSGDERTGWDPDLVDDWEEVEKLWKEGRGPPQRPYYVPYRKHYPLIPEDHPDIKTPQDVVHELDRYEEFLVWRSYIFKDGSSYEGTVFDDLAHGKGVYITPLELCRYEGEWFQNQMEGHGVLEVNVPVIEPPPDSEAAKKMRAQGKILQTDYLDEDDKAWVIKDIEDKEEMGDDMFDAHSIEDDEAWMKYFGEKPQKGRYRYAGQWKHNRMHGCGVYEINGEPLSGQFYFGELLPWEGDCNDDQLAMHHGLAEIAAAKARMFILKPDGMVREAKGPYTDPSHPYMYEESDMWMAPGFINAFYEVPDTWKRYVEEVDEEREMWLNSFLHSPLRLPMPAELEYQWAQDDEFILLSNRDSNPMYQDPLNLDPELEGEILLHTPTGNLINWAEDADGNLRFFLQPFTEDGEIRPEEVVPLPLGFDEVMGLVDEEGKPIDESRRGLSGEERKKLEAEDRKKEKKEKFNAKLEAMREKGKDKKKRLETEQYIRNLEKELEGLLLEEKFQAELEDRGIEPAVGAGLDKDGDAAKQDDEHRPELENEQGQIDDEDRYEDTKGGRAIEEQENVNEGKGDSRSGSDGRESEGKDSADEGKGGSASGNDGRDSDDGSDGEEELPRSFGKVAMVIPDDKATDNRKQEGSSRPPFPTVFASLSMVPQMALKQVVESAVGVTPMSWISRVGSFLSGRCKLQLDFGSPDGGRQIASGLGRPFESPQSPSWKAQKLSVPKRAIISARLHSSSRFHSIPPMRPRQRRMPVADGMLSAFGRPRQDASRRLHSRQSCWNRINSPAGRKQGSSPAERVSPDKGMEVLTLALPVQIL